MSTRIELLFNTIDITHTTILVDVAKARANLVFSDGTVTSRFAEALELASSGEPLKEYPWTRYHWMMFDFDTINWNAHGAAIKVSNNQLTLFNLRTISSKLQDFSTNLMVANNVVHCARVVKKTVIISCNVLISPRSTGGGCAF
jgi:hypothetical protein